MSMTPEQYIEHRAKAEYESSLDLAKDTKHLLADIHDELIRFDRDPNERVANAQKRLASLTVKNAEASERVSKETLVLQERVTVLTEKLHRLTVVLVWLTIAILLLTTLSVYPIIKNLPCFPKVSKDSNTYPDNTKTTSYNKQM